MRRFRIDRRQLAAKGNITGRRTAQTGIAGYVRNEVERIFGEPARAGRAIGTQVAKDERLRVADPLVLDHVEINIQTIRAQDGGTPLQLLAVSKPRVSGIRL